MPKTIPILTAVEYQQMICMKPQDPPTPKSHDAYLRDRLIIYLMLEAGLRSSEVSLILHHDCYHDHTAGRIIKVTQATAKRQVARDIPATQFLANALYEFRPADHPAHTANPSPPLISSITEPKGTKPRTNQRVVNRWSKQLLGHEIWPHVLRHTFAMRLLDSGCSLPVLQTLMGHKNLSSTQVYMHTNSVHAADAIANMSRHTGQKDPPPPEPPPDPV